MQLDELRRLLEPKRPADEVGNDWVALGCLGVLALSVAAGASTGESALQQYKSFLIYGAFALGIWIAFAFPVHRFRQMAREEVTLRHKAAPKAVFRFEGITLQTLQRVSPSDTCHICAGNETVWRDMDAGRIPRFLLCENCARDLNLIEGISISPRNTEFPLKKSVAVSVIALLLAAAIPLPVPIQFFVRIVVCGTAAACFAFRVSPSLQSRSPLAEIEQLAYVVIILVFFMGPHLTAFTWRLINGLTSSIFIFAAATTKRYMYGRDMSMLRAIEERREALADDNSGCLP